MYAFRKPFTAGEFADTFLWGIEYKSVLIASQVLGYTLSKFIGVKVIAEMQPARRATAILLLIGVAELALLGFAIVPPHYGFLLLFINGLPLGMVFGVVLSFLEGRRFSEALTAGLCASFIVSSGVVKSVGRTLILNYGISEYWMPFWTGAVFAIPLILAVVLLSKIPPPTMTDNQLRMKRQPMNRAQRWAFFRRHAFGIIGIVVIYVSLTVLRSVRDDFAVEIWKELGREDAGVFAKAETAVMVGVMVVCGSTAGVKSNRRGLLTSLGFVLGGFLLVLATVISHSIDAISPFAMMVLLGMGTYVPYVVIHTTVFERLIATFREQANVGYLMYLADAFGYLGYVGIMLLRPFMGSESGYLELLTSLAFQIALGASIIATILLIYYLRTAPHAFHSKPELMSAESDRASGIA